MYTSKRINSASSYLNGIETGSYIPVEVQFRHMPESKRVQWLVEQMMERFDKFPIGGAKAHVVVEATHRRGKEGLFQVRIKLSVPGERLYVAHSSEKTGMHDGVYSAVADVFDSIEKQLLKRHGRHVRRRLQKAEVVA